MSETIDIAFAVDRGYFDQVAVTIASIVAGATDPGALRFHLVHAEDEAWVTDQMARWSLPAAVETVRTENSFAAPGSVLKHISLATWLRMLLPVALPHIDRVIYLDADLVVLRDIRDLWRVDLGTSAIGGVVDIGMYRHLTRGEAHGDHRQRDHLVELGHDPLGHEYVNAGVLLMNLDHMRREDFSGRARQLYESRGDRLMYADQDIINSLMRGQVRLLDPRWNVLATSFSRADSRHHHYVPDALRNSLELQRAEPWIIHYTGAKKPWNSVEAWRAEEWWRFALLSGLGWCRPAPPPKSVGRTIKEGWRDVQAKLSRWQYRFRRDSSVRRQKP